MWRLISEKLSRNATNAVDLRAGDKRIGNFTRSNRSSIDDTSQTVDSQHVTRQLILGGRLNATIKFSKHITRQKFDKRIVSEKLFTKVDLETMKV